MQTNPESTKSNRTLLYVAGGCVVLLFLCVVCSVAMFVFARPQLQQMVSQISGLGNNQALSNAPGSELATTVAPFPPATAAPGVVPPPTSAPSSGSGNPFIDALTKAKGATKYRVEFAMIFGGMDKGQYKETPFIAFNGEVDGNNSHITSSGGLLSTLYTGSETGKVEITDVGGTEYIRGASSLMGFIKLDPNSWYISNDKSSSSSFASFAKPDEFSSWTGSARSTDFSKTGTESVDGQSCDVYLYDMKSIQNQALVGFLGSAQDKNAFGAIDKGEIKLWLCGDGYVHKYSLDYEGHDPKNATAKGAMKMNWHVWDVNNPGINIQAPAGAKPMPTK